MYTFQNLNMGVNDKVRTDLDLHKGSNLGMGVYAIERSYPKVGVGQIWKQYLTVKKTMHTFENKLKHCANADADADDTNDWVTTSALQWHSPSELTKCVSYFFMKNPNMKFQNPSMHSSKFMLCIKVQCKNAQNDKGP